jgi:hypothetical protein
MPKNKTWEEKFDTWTERTDPRGPIGELWKAYNTGRRHQREALVEYPKWDKTPLELAFWKETAEDYRLEYTKQKKINDALGVINGSLEVQRDALKNEVRAMNYHMYNVSRPAIDRLEKERDQLLEEKYNRRPWWKFWG